MAQESSWWSYASQTASSAWNTVQSSAQDVANDFSTAFQEENEETIEKIKEKVDKEKISNQFSKTTESIKNMITTTLQSISAESIKSDTIKRVIPKCATFICEPFALHTIHISDSNHRSFEKERSTYCNDPSTMSQHKEKFAKFVETDLGLSDDDICLKGRCLLHTNSAIRTYYDQLVATKELDEATFWKRYFYAKYQAKLREILISKHTSSKDGNIESESDEDDDEIELGDSVEIENKEQQNVEDNHKNDNEDKEEVELGVPINKVEKQSTNVISENATIEKEKLSEETSWAEVGNSDEHRIHLKSSKNTTVETSTESIAKIVIDKSEENVVDITNAEDNVENKENNESDDVDEIEKKSQNDETTIQDKSKDIIENNVDQNDETNNNKTKPNEADQNEKAKTNETTETASKEESEEIDSDNLSLSNADDIELDENEDDDSDWGDWD